MGRPRKIQVEEEIKIKKIDEDGHIVRDSKGQTVYETDLGVPGLFQPQDWDVAEEVNGMESFREYQREQNESF